MINLSKFIEPPKGYVSQEKREYRKTRKVITQNFKGFAKSIISLSLEMAAIGISLSQ